MGGTSLAENWLVGEFSSSLPGFLIAFNKEGKILYTSDNILDYLGNTVVSIYLTSPRGNQVSSLNAP